MPHRFAPAEPAPLAAGATRAQRQRWIALRQSWMVGEALRAMAEAQSVPVYGRRHIPDDVPFLGSPSFGEPTARRLAADGKPVSMEAICAWVDREREQYKPFERAYRQLELDLPSVAFVVWLRHVDLWTVREIAEFTRTGDRSITRQVAVGNLRLYAAICNPYDTKTGRSETRRATREADTTEARFWRDADADLSDAELAYAGLDIEKKKAS